MSIQEKFNQTNSDSHPTRKLLLEKVVSLIATRPIEEITSELVLEESGISKGSMYHHYADFPELLEYAYVEIFSRFAQTQMAALNGILMGSTSRDELLFGLRRITHGNSDPSLYALRLARVTAIANALSSPRMAKLISEVQETLTQELADYFIKIQNRGWGNPNLDPRTVSVFVQAYIVGSTVDLITPSQMDFDGWVELIDLILGEVIISENPSARPK